MDSVRHVIPDGAIAIDRDRILDIGKSSDLEERYHTAEVIDARGAIAMPGLINTHTHLATVMFRGLAEEMPLEPWLKAVWGYENAWVNSETVATAARLAMLESIMGGITCAVDMYWFPGVTAQEASAIGFRLAAGPVFIEGDKHPDNMNMGQRELFAREFVQRYSNDPFIVPMFMPHGTCTDSPELLTRVKRLADEQGVYVNLHAAETATERDAVLKRYGKTPIRLLAEAGLLDGRSLLAHCVHVDDEEIGLLARRASVSHNPMSNLKLASGIAPLAKMAAAGVRISLGTDGAQSGNDLDMWLAMRLASVLQKNATGDTRCFPARDIVAMATLEAANAIGLGEKIGSIEKGKLADIILVNIDKPHMIPLYDVYTQLVYAAGREDVSTVIIGGKVLIREGTFVSLDPEEAIERMRTLAERIKK
jgi:5-methylthioadenosine/S-adenosylhomocysteine deaminase